MISMTAYQDENNRTFTKLSSYVSDASIQSPFQMNIAQQGGRLPVTYESNFFLLHLEVLYSNKELHKKGILDLK